MTILKETGYIEEVKSVEDYRGVVPYIIPSTKSTGKK